MPDIIRCPSCQRKLQVPETLLGQDVQCPNCGSTFVAALSDNLAPPLTPPVPEPRSRETPRSSARRRRRPDFADEGDNEDDDFYRYRSRRRDVLPHRGSMILALGIVSILFCGIIFGPIAWILGQQDLNAIRAGRMDPEGEDLTNAGRICGILGTLWNLLVIVLVCLGIFVAIMQDIH